VKIIFVLSMYALLITVISHFLYPDYGIKFGILHFIALGTLLLAPVAALDSPTITLIVGGIWLYITSNNLIPLARGHSPFGLNLPYSNEIINTITGKFVHYNTADYFPLNTKLILLICGLFLAQVIHPKLKPSDDDKTSVLEEIGKNSVSPCEIPKIIAWSHDNSAVIATPKKSKDTRMNQNQFP
jgi:uncharacterized membrane protein